MPAQKVDFSQAQVGFDGIDVTAPARPQQRPETPVARPGSDGDVTRESPTTEAVRKLSVEPITAGLYHLTYACLLVPRFSSHFITGDLSERMDEWLPNVCIAFGWRLEKPNPGAFLRCAGDDGVERLTNPAGQKQRRG